MAPALLVLLSQRLGAITPVEERLRDVGAEIRGAPLWSLQEIREHALDARVIILGAVEPFDATALEALPALVAIVRRGVGTDNVDLEAATRLGIVVANVPDASVEEVSDHALAMLLGLERQLPPLDRAVRIGLWARDPGEIKAIRAPIRRLSALTLGIIGFGRIGQALARKASPSYRRILASDPVIDSAAAQAAGAELVPLEELFSSADHLSVHAPLTEATRHLVDAGALALMKPDAIVVNTARGGLIEEAAILAAIRSGRLRAAGLDVTEHEPIPAGDPLLGEPRVLLTAHSAASSVTAEDELIRRSVDAAAAILYGRWPDSVANPEVLSSPALRRPLTRER